MSKPSISTIKVYVYEVVYDLKNKHVDHEGYQVEKKKYFYKKIKKIEIEKENKFKSITPKTEMTNPSNKSFNYIFSMNTITNNESNKNKSLNDFFSKNNLLKLYKTIYLGHSTRINIDNFIKPNITGKNIYGISFLPLITRSTYLYKKYYDTLKNNTLEMKKHSNFINKKDLKSNSEIIYRIRADNSEKIIVIGDIHGSFHSFFRIFIRLHVEGIITNEYKVNKDYRIIFLGDVIDRGNFSIEVMYIIFKLIINNNTDNNLKVILLRGNHEEYVTYERYGFETEIAYKFREVKDKNKNKKKYNYTRPEIIIDLINEFYKIIPSAIILHHCNTTYWLCHGGFPRKLNGINDFPDSNKIIASNENIKINIIDKISQIRWNDFISSKKSELSNRDTFGGNLFRIGTDCLENFLDKANIDFIIRGHNDNESNAMLLARYKNSDENFFHINERKSIKTSFSPPEAVKYSDLEEGSKKTKEEIATIYPNTFSKNNSTNSFNTAVQLFPVLTISNNSDNDRFLHPDSYIIITPE